MTLKACSYRDCQNYVLDNVPSGNFTIFQFPKNPERREKWMKLGQAPRNLPPTRYFYCSDHFDSKFMAVNQRRTILVGEAIPFPYSVDNENPSENINTDNVQTLYFSEENYGRAIDNEYLLCEVKGNRREKQVKNEVQQEDFQVESTMPEDEDGNLKHSTLYDFKLGEELVDNTEEVIEISNKRSLDSDKLLQQPVKLVPKRKLNHGQDSSLLGDKVLVLNCRTPLPCNAAEEHEKSTSSSKTHDEIRKYSKIKSSTAASSSGRTERQINDINIEKMISCDKKITKFIYKGEEYVQMPLTHYVDEKLAMMRKIEKLSLVLQNIGREIDTYREEDTRQNYKN